ncbi:hypothetical protein ACFQ3B_25595 [Stackebrandtia endophytica]|uniref:hypothetical protein n=1 Tax=Stackebrandtia endophytica TaxID=1496996 RepID=UPI0014772F24|nr:hypothetical protein [Stackebrandtia endophytica]
MPPSRWTRATGIERFRPTASVTSARVSWRRDVGDDAKQIDRDRSRTGRNSRTHSEG